VRAGLGVAVLAPWSVRPLLDAAAIVARPLTARGLHREWRATMPKDLARLDYVREFVDLLRKNTPTANRPMLVRPAEADTRVGPGRHVGRPLQRP
jgi:DNA-binding transcriptional LysR family regulator